MPVGRVDPEGVRVSRIERALEAVRERLRSSDAGAAFVHAASDADSDYLGADAVVVTTDDAVWLRASGVERDRTGETPHVDHRLVDDPAGAVAGVLDELGANGTVLTPRGVRHDVALFVERAGYDLASTAVLTDARAVKTTAERDAVRALGTAATAGFDTAVERLATADVEADTLWTRGANGAAPLTVERLTNAVAAALAGDGVETPGVRVRGVGDGALPADRPIVVECRPAGAGVCLRAAWTLVVDGDGGWERRAQLALDAGHRAGRGTLAAALDGESVTVGEVAAEVRAEVTAYGFGEPTVDVYGVGQSAYERPRGSEELSEGQVVVVAASVTRAADETVHARRRGDVVTHVETLCLDGEVEPVVSLPSSLSPARALNER